ncbi:MAG: hypothetical protein EAX96_17215 [Candidatus Lokiarchaeota archaeon]|nr:hypothetical protein [Candidatus Lokiarchaeota archaeon]
MKKTVKAFIISMLIFLMIGVQIKLIYDYSNIINLDSKKNVPLESESYMDPPRKPYSLKLLVEDLQLASSDTTDTDGDGIYDTVEYVIGTNYNNIDTDFDLLNDSYEIYNISSDPQDEDTNDDGLADYFEVEGIYSLDIDGDGTPNVWDFDNDDDGVNDAIDISPFAKSTTHQEFDLTVKTDGKPININFQLIPENKEHLKLYYQSWDWPYDDEGSMQDLDNSEDDVKIAPWLRVTPNIIPTQEEVEARGEQVISGTIEVPLFATFDQGNIVAFHGTFYYPERSAMDLNLKTELIWKITGYTDLPAVAYNASNNKVATIRSDGVVVASGDDVEQGILQIIELEDNKIALKVQNGQFITVLDNQILASNGSSIGSREEFTLTNQGGNLISLKAHNNLYVTLGVDDVLIASSSSVATFQNIDMGFAADVTHLATYNEPFRLTGFGIEENYNCNLSIFYHEDKNQTIAATMLLTNYFCRNSSTILDEMPAILVEHNINIYNQSIFSYSDNYEALTYMSNEMIPTALSIFSGSQIVPLTSIIEEAAKANDMFDNLGAYQYIMGDSCTIDFTSESLTIIKSLKINFYNSSTYIAFTLAEIYEHTNTWGLDNDTSYTLGTMMLLWFTGIKIITYNDVSLNFAPPENEVITTVNAVALVGLNALGVIASLIITFQAYRALSNLLAIPACLRGLFTSAKSFQALKSVSNLGALAGGGTKITKALQFITKYHVLDVIGVLIGIALAIWAACEIAKTVGGRLGQELGAAYGIAGSIVAIVYGVILAVLFSSVIGAIIAVVLIILDLIFGFSSKLTEWLAKVLFGSPHDYHHAEPSVDMEGSLETTTFDKDNNGLDVGDRIEILAHLIGTVKGYGESKTLEGWSYNVPWIRIDSPDGSGSVTSMNLEHSLGSNAWDWPSQTNLLNRTSTGSSGGTTRSDKYDSIAWIEPGISMANFPIKLQISSRYKLMQKWYHRPAWYFGFKCWHTDWQKGSTPAEDLVTLYYDVMPGNLNDFLKWGILTANDRDGDGLNDTYEMSEGKSNIYRYDTDSDGLNDRYELEIGTDPQCPDTDEDSLLDGHEAIYGANATDGDTDDDGIFDFLEVAGWAISFNYCNQVFEMRVFSDPTNNDTDSDGVDDGTEYWSGLNPRSSDTNGDGTKDIGSPQVEKCGIFKNSTNIKNDIESFIANASDFAVDANGFVYIPLKNGTSTDYFILKLDSNLNYCDNWSLSLQPGKVAVDDKNGFLYIENLTGNSFSRYYINGTFINQSQAVGSEPVVGLDVDSNGYFYVARFIPLSFAQIDKYFSNGTHLATFGSYGTDPNQFDNLSAITVDDTNEIIYALDGNRIVKLNSSDGEYLATLPNGYQNMIDIAVGPDGWVYVLDLFDLSLGEGCVRKFDHNGMEDRNFILTDKSNTPPWNLIHYPMRLAIAQNITNTSYYVLEQASFLNPFPNITVFFENITLIPPQINGTLYDWDDDEMGNLKEVVGWNIIYKNSGSIIPLSVNSSPFMIDTDFDGLSDYEEFLLNTHPWNPDTDGDGLSDLYENQIGTNITNDDTDEDGLSDSNEILIGSNPYNMNDTDDDGLSDLLEFNLGSNPASNDTDSDGALDDQEYFGNSSLFDPDTDDDFMLDGLEYFYDCDPNDIDSDDDGLIDGDELIYNTNPIKNDTDDDGAIDGLEVDLWLDPLVNDTDGDGLLDFIELEWGSNPYVMDTDYDGVNDSADTDFQANFTENIILAYDQDPNNESSDFIQKLAEIGNVTVVSYNELIANHTQAPYIVLLGVPDPENSSSVGGLIYNLLEDTGNQLSLMTENNTRHIAVRYGVYAPKQTIVMLPRALYLDVGKVFSILKGKNVTIANDSCLIQYRTSPIMQNETNYFYGIPIDEIDILKTTDMIGTILLDDWALPIIQVSKYNQSSTPHSITITNGLNFIEKSIFKYFEINLTANGTFKHSVPEATFLIFYRFSDLDRDGNGIAEDPWDINENALFIYYFDENTGSWMKLSLELDWVLEIQVNTTDQEVYGENYAGYIMIKVTHLSLFTVTGVLNSPYWDTFWSFFIVISILMLTFGVAAEIIYRERERIKLIKEKKPFKDKKQSKSKIIDEKEAIEEQGTIGIMDNIEWEIEDVKINLKVDITKNFGKSSSGKTIIVANSKGGRRLKGTNLTLGMVVYKYPDELNKNIRPRRFREMQNVEIGIDGNIVTFTIDTTKEFGPSSTGKTIIVASSRGNGTIKGTNVIFGLNVYRSRKSEVKLP